MPTRSPPSAEQRFGLDDPGRAIQRDPRSLAQRIASIAAQAGADGCSLAELAGELPAFSQAEIDAAIALLPPAVTIAGGRIRVADV